MMGCMGLFAFSCRQDNKKFYSCQKIMKKENNIKLIDKDDIEPFER